MAQIHYGASDVGGAKISYREAGPPDAPRFLLLHGFPTGGHMFRDLIPLLADSFHLVAPDLPRFGQSDLPPGETFKYTFENLADLIARFTEAIGLKRFAVYIFQLWRASGIALKYPERITATVSQNGNAHEEGLSDGWNPIQKLWREPNQKNRQALQSFLALERRSFNKRTGFRMRHWSRPTAARSMAIIWRDPERMRHSSICFSTVQATSSLYPQFQGYFRKHKPPMPGVWGKNDPFFLPAGAEAFRRDNP